MLCSLLLYKELPQEVCWQCSRTYTVRLSAILTPWTQQGTSRSGWSSSCITDTAFLRSVRFIITPGTGSVFIIVPLVSIHLDGCISQEGIRPYYSGRSPGGGQGNPLSPWTEQPGGLQSMALHGVGPSWSNLAQHVSITQIYCGTLPHPVVRLCPYTMVTDRATSPGISNLCSPQTHGTTEMHVAARKITFRQLQHRAVPDPADEDVGHALSFVANLGDTALWREAFLCFPVPHPHSL